MNSRERVLCAIKRKEVDKIPCNLRAEKPTLSRLYAYLGFDDYEKLLEEMCVDVRYINCVEPPETNMGNFIQNHWGERYIYRKNEWGCYRDDMPGALESASSLKEFEEFPWPTVSMMDYSDVKAQCQKYDDYGIVYGFGDIFTRPSIVRGFERTLLDLYENPEFVHFLVEKFTDFYIEEYTKAFYESGKRIDVFLMMGDLSTQLAPLISTSMFDTFIGPHLKRLADRIHELGTALMFHSCGNARVFYDRLINCGVDIIDPMQRTDEGMSPETLAADFGDKVCFHGGIDVQTTLPFGTPEDVKAEVERYIAAFKKPRKGYICCSAHFMQHDTPPENIVALYEAIKEQ